MKGPSSPIGRTKRKNIEENSTTSCSRRLLCSIKAFSRSSSASRRWASSSAICAEQRTRDRLAQQWKYDIVTKTKIKYCGIKNKVCPIKSSSSNKEKKTIKEHNKKVKRNKSKQHSQTSALWQSWQKFMAIMASHPLVVGLVPVLLFLPSPL